MLRRTVLILSFTSTSSVRSFARVTTPNRHSYLLTNPCPRRISSYRLFRPQNCRTSWRYRFSSTSFSDSFDSDITHFLKKTQPNDVGSILHTTIRILQFYDAPEPVLSACHIVAFTLQENNDVKDMPVRWEDNLFAYLLQVLEPMMDTYFNSCITANTDLDLETFLLSFPLNRPSLSNTNDKNSSILNRNLTSLQIDQLISLLSRRIQREPLQYIFGKWDFYDFTLKVRSPCLCPRPETEELVEYVSQDVRRMIASRCNYQEGGLLHGKETSQTRKIRILDVGSGTGAIGIALARMFPFEVEVVAIDIKKEAVELSLENAHLLLPMNSSFMEDGSLYQALLCSAADYTNKIGDVHYFQFDMVVSNPPYIPLEDMSSLSEDVVKYEDVNALCGGFDGMDVIRTIIERLEEWSSISFPLFSDFAICWIEVDPSQPCKIERLLSQVSPSFHTVRYLETRKDLQGLDRFVKLAIHRTM